MNFKLVVDNKLFSMLPMMNRRVVEGMDIEWWEFEYKDRSWYMLCKDLFPPLAHPFHTLWCSSGPLDYLEMSQMGKEFQLGQFFKFSNTKRGDNLIPLPKSNMSS